MAEADGHRYGYNALNLRVFKPRMGVAGDITGDGQVTEQDLALLQQALRGDAPTTLAMDCNQDGVVDQRDTACIARKIGGFRNQGQTRGRGNQGPPTAASNAQEPVQLGWVLFVYDEQGQLVGEYDEQRNPLRLYVWLENLPLAVIDQTGIHYLHTDHLHTPRVATDQTGQVSWQADYTPFGEVTVTVNTVEVNLRFPGQYHDRETGLHQNWHREYAPHLGRYTQSDPIGLLGGMNMFKYAGENPIRSVDHMGLHPAAMIPPWARRFIRGTASGGAGGMYHFILAGFGAESGIVVGTDGSMCIYTARCWQVGPGVFGALGGSGGLGISATTFPRSGRSIGLFLYGGISKVVGGSVSVSSGGLGGVRGFGGAGGGVAAGIHVCETTVDCLTDNQCL